MLVQLRFYQQNCRPFRNTLPHLIRTCRNGNDGKPSFMAKKLATTRKDNTPAQPSLDRSDGISVPDTPKDKLQISREISSTETKKPLLQSLHDPVETKSDINPWKVKAGLRKAVSSNKDDFPNNSSAHVAPGGRVETVTGKAEVTRRKTFKDPTSGTNAGNSAINISGASRPTIGNLPRAPFLSHRRVPQATKSNDAMPSITAHPTEIPAMRSTLTRGNSTACIMSPTRKKKAFVGTSSTAQGVSKVRKTVKALEFSHMLTDEDLVKLLHSAHTEIEGDGAKQTEFGNSKGLAALVKILKKYEENVRVLEACFLLIAELAQVETNRDALALNGCIEVVLIAMLKWEHDLVLQEYALYAIASLAQNRKYQEWIVQSNGLEVIRTTQEAFTSNIKIQTACLSALRNLAKDNTDNALAIVAKGLIRSIIDVVKDSANSREFALHKEACAALATLARYNDSNRGAIAKAGGIRTTLRALEAFPDDPILQCLGLDALCMLIYQHSHNADNVVQLGGISLTIQILRVYENDLPVMIQGFRFAKVLTEFDHISHQFTGEGGLKVVLPAMRTYEDSNVIQEEGCSILCNLALQHESKGLICTSGGIKMIVLAMKRLFENSLVQKNGVKALDSLATNDENKRYIAAGGGITATLAAMKGHRELPALQGLAAGALRKLASLSRNRSIMNANEGIQIVEAAMESNPNHNYLQQNGKQLLFLLDPSREGTDDGVQNS